jgi:sugar phosphate isomerase/epimerase
LEIPLLATYLSLGETEAIAEVLQAAAAIGVPAVRLLTPRYDGSQSYDGLLEESRRHLAALEDLCRETKVKAALELHLGYIIPSASAARRLLEGFSPDWVGAIYDPGNMVCEGMENWKMGIQILGPYLSHVHVKNAAWYFSPEQGWQAVWTPLGEGIVYWGEVISYLREAGYDGWLSVEDLREAPTEALLAEDLDFLRNLLAQEPSLGS